MALFRLTTIYKLELVGARPLHLLSQTVRSLKSPTGLSLLRKREFHLLR